MAKKVLPAALLCLTAALLSLCLGAVWIPMGRLWDAFCAGPQETAGFIFWYVRLPRTAACLLAGAALSVSGAVIQTVLHNRLASPSIIGVNAGAGLAVTLCCALGFLSGWAIAGAAFLGAMITALLIMLVAQMTGASRTTVILGGIAVNAFLNALSEGITTLIPEVGMMSGDFRIGGFASVAYIRLLPAAVLISVALGVLFLLHNELEILGLGTETAHSLGLPVAAFRIGFLVLAAALAGCAVSFSGLLGFVGLVVPQAVRKITGGDIGQELPVCALAGAGFVTLCDLLARVLFAPYELPVGILLSLLGGPFFLWQLLKPKGGRVNA